MTTPEIAEEVLSPYVYEQLPGVLTFGGEARSGKGTSVDAVHQRLDEVKVQHRVIDQGLKFRALAELAVGTRLALDDPTVISEFLTKSQTHIDLLSMLNDVATMNKEDVRSLLYNSAISEASGQIGRVPISHDVTVRLLKNEVVEAKERGDKVILIDGRAMEKYGQQFQDEKIALFVLGYYFRCDSSVAAARSLGLFVDHENMTDAQKIHLLAEIMKIRERNRSDALRERDPMREPVRAYPLDLPNFYNWKPGDNTVYGKTHDATQVKMVKLDTTYTHTVEEMTKPVVAMSMHALLFKSIVQHSDVGIGTTNLS
jgi:cytidylate kinase